MFLVFSTYLRAFLQFESFIRASCHQKSSTMVAPFFDWPARAVWCEQEVSITVGDTSGFVFAGERQTSVSLLPGQEVRVAWTMVAYNAGLMALPDVQVASARYSARMKMTSSNKASLAVYYVCPSVDAEKKM
jgi:hypothetical protein